MQRFKLVLERGIICHQKIYQSGSFSDENTHIKGLCQLESMRSEVMQITFNCQNSIVFNA